jgi:hypothetical protein
VCVRPADVCFTIYKCIATNTNYKCDIVIEPTATLRVTKCEYETDRTETEPTSNHKRTNEPIISQLHKHVVIIIIIVIIIGHHHHPVCTISVLHVCEHCQPASSLGIAQLIQPERVFTFIDVFDVDIRYTTFVYTDIESFILLLCACSDQKHVRLLTCWLISYRFCDFAFEHSRLNPPPQFIVFSLVNCYNETHTGGESNVP